ncbi:MAG: hypothetical protein V4607_05350 [Pseudomonadota bacterium]
MKPGAHHLIRQFLLRAGLGLALLYTGAAPAQLLSIGTSKSFSVDNVPTNGRSDITIGLSTTVATSGISITDFFPQTPGSMILIPPGFITGTACGGTFTDANGATLTTGSISAKLNNGSFPGLLGGSCTFTFAIKADKAGTYTNTTGAPTGNKAGLIPITGAAASATLYVYDAPVLTKVITADHIEVGGDSIVTYTISNPATNPGALGAITFTDSSYNSIAKLVGNAVNISCNGANPGAAAASSFTGTTTFKVTALPAIQPGMSCTLRLHVTGASAGTYSAGFSLTSGTLDPSTGTSTVAFATAPSSAPATLVVGPLLNVSKSFPATFGTGTNNNVQTNVSTGLAVQVQTLGTTSDISALAISDSFPTTPGAMTLADGTSSNSCTGVISDSGGGSLGAGDTGIKLTAGLLPDGPASCSIGANVKAATRGSYVNTTGVPSGTYNYCLPGQNGTSVPCTSAPATGAAAAATLNVYDPPVVTKSFTASTIISDGTSVMTITVTNPSGNPGTISGISFTDVLPTTPGQMKVAATPGVSSCATGTFTAAANATSVSYSGGSLAPGASCTLKVNVTASTTGTYTNAFSLDNTGPNTSMSVSTGGGKVNFSSVIATANLVVNYPPPTVTVSKKTAPLDGVNQNFSVTPSNFTDNTAANINAGTATTFSRTVANVSTATTLSEAGVSGWRGLSTQCVANTAINGETLGAIVFSSSAPGTLASTYAPSIPANTFKAGNDYRCTISNDAIRVTVAKQTVPVSGVNQAFSVTPSNFTDNAAGTINANAAGATTFTRILSNPASATSFSEAAVSGWAGQSLICVASTGNNGVTQGATVFSNTVAAGAGATYAPASIPANTFVAGNSYVCTITNGTPPRVRYQKLTTPASQNQNFTVPAFNGAASATINATTAASAYSVITSPQTTANLTENGVAGWTATSLKCVADTANNGVSLGAAVVNNTTAGTVGVNYDTSVPGNTFVAGNDYSCTFTNAVTTVTIKKKTAPADGINQDFGLNPTNFTIPNSGFINASTGTKLDRVVANLGADTFMKENVPVGWTGTGLKCVANTGNNSETLGRVINSSSPIATAQTVYEGKIDKNSFIVGNDYTCTITNEVVRIRYLKQTIPANQNVNFTVQGYNGAPATSTLNATTNASAGYALVQTPQNADNLIESASSDWAAQSLKCVADTGNNGVTQGAVVVNRTDFGSANTNYSTPIAANTFVFGNDYSCTWINARTRVTIGKRTAPTDGVNQEFGLNPTNFTIPNSGFINASTGSTLDRVVANVGADTLLKENVATGWIGIGVECVASTSNNSETLGRVINSSSPTAAAGAVYEGKIDKNSFVAGNDYSCKVINGTTSVALHVVKKTAPVDGVNQNFLVTPSNFASNTASNINAGTAATLNGTLANLAAATTLSEAATVGWRGTGLQCVANSAFNGETLNKIVFTSATAGTTNTAYATTIPANTFKTGNDYSCTITNSNAISNPQLTVAKTVMVLNDPVNGGSSPKAIPGATVVYAITVSNGGPGSASGDSIVITDPISSNLALCTGNSSGNSGLTVAFIDGSGGNASGLTALTAADISYSNTAGGGAPFTYSPAANSCDAAITGLRINPKGSMSGASGSNTPTFTLQFKASVR